MKRDAREIAHLIKAFKGGAEYLWNNFDQPQLSAIYAECAAIDEEIQREVNADANRMPSGGANSISDGNGSFAWNNLEDIPTTPEEDAAFAKLVEETKRKQAERLAAKMNKA